MAEVFEKIEFDRVNKRPIAFDGIVVATVDSRDFGEVTDVEPVDRWTELFVYRTRAGKFILRTVGRSTARGEDDRNRAIIIDKLDPGEVMDFFEQFWLSKELYSELGMDPTAHID